MNTTFEMMNEVLKLNNPRKPEVKDSGKNYDKSADYLNIIWVWNTALQRWDHWRLKSDEK